MSHGGRGAKMFYGWVVLGAAFVVIMVGVGSMFSVGVFLIPLQEEFGWNRSQISLASLLNWFAFGLFSFLLGALSDRIGTRRVVFCGGITLGLGMVLSSLTREIWHLYLTFGLLGGMGVGALYVPLSATATRWFTTNRGLAVAIVSAGNGIGILAIAPLARHLISTYGSATAFVVMGVLAWAIILPAALLLRNSPVESGYQAYGAGSQLSLGRPVGEDAHDAEGLLGREGGGSRRVGPTFWVITLTHCLCCAAHAGPILHMAPFAMDVGLPKMIAATLLGVSGFVSIVGRVGTGVIADRMGAKTTLIAALSLQATAIVLYLWAGPLWTFIALAVVFGVAYGGVMPLYTVLTRQYFGQRVMGAMYGAVFGISCVGMGIGSYLGGVFFDLAGSYAWLYLVSFLLGGSAVALAACLRPPRTGVFQPQMNTDEHGLQTA
ncbi:MAG: MFS transporter [Nitrospinae bacterium]|nr:MFS transporter [Nitrospinota bacterium]